MARANGSSTRAAMVWVAVLAGLALGGWAVVGDSAVGAGPPGPSSGDGNVARPVASAFRYADAKDVAFLRLDVSAPPARGTAVPVTVSRHAALAGARRGSLEVELPDGTRFPVRYERSESAPDGIWTFIGRVATDAGDLAAVITFGRDGVFGMLPTPDGRMLALTTRSAQAYLGPAPGGVPHGTDASRHPDFLVPPPQATVPAGTMQAQRLPVGAPTHLRPARAAIPAGAVMQAADDTGADAVIDVLAAYTTNLLSWRGSSNAVHAEWHNLVAIANQAHIDSGSHARFAIADFVEVDIPAEDLNEDALYAITNNDVPGGVDLRARRDAVAADLVALLRPHAAEDPTCGIAWLPGGALSGSRMSADYGFSVSATGDCGPLVLAHELGHNLGLMHDRDTVMQQGGGALQFGAFHFSFGYRQAGPPAFATVMAYAEDDQPWIGRFSHPGTAQCSGAGCGIAEHSDNVRATNLTAPTVARFRDPLETISILDARVLEHDDHLQTLAFEVRAGMPAPAGGVTFDVVVSDGTATGGADWIPSGSNRETLELWAGYRSTMFYVDVPPDVEVEGDETVNVRLENVQGMAVFDAEAVGVILDDDPRVRVRGRVRFPESSTPPPRSAVAIEARTQRLGAYDSYSNYLEPMGTGYRYEFMAPRGGAATIEVGFDEGVRFIGSDLYLAPIDASVDGVHLWAVEAVSLAGTLRGAAHDTPLRLWNAHGDGRGIVVNQDPDMGGLYNAYASLVYPAVPMRLEALPPPPYARQLVEIPALHGDGSVDVELRQEPSLTIPHASVAEGSAAGGNELVFVTAELSEPAPAGGVAFRVVTGGTAGADDFSMQFRSFTIPEGDTTVHMPISVIGDDRGEGDETVELRISDIQGAAWNPGPGSLRIVTDEARAGDGSCTGSSEGGSVRMCQ